MEHGGDLTGAMARHGGVLADWLDLSTGINPWPWPVPDGLVPAAAWHRLPGEAETQALAAAARKAYGVPDQVAVVAAPGTQALIQWLPRLAAPGPVAVVGPTYGEHALAWRAAGHEVVEIETLAALPREARHAVVVNPNNPDGRITDRSALLAAAGELARRGGWLVVDEAFADVAPEASVVGADEAGVVVLRSFGKFYGLAGLRLGFALAAPALAARIAAALGPWAVSGPALAIGRAALADEAWARDMRARLGRQTAALDVVLTGIGGCDPVGGTPLYRLVRRPGSAQVHEALAAERIWVRRFAWSRDLLRFGLPPDEAGLERLTRALAGIGTAHG